jgi:hypothetical protein
MNASYAYTAAVLPIGKDISLPEDGGPIVIEENTFKTWYDTPWHVKVRLNHDVLKTIGQCLYLRARKGWLEAEFILDPGLRSELTVGMPVSVGITRMTKSGLLLLQEISIVRHGAIRGAEILSRRAMKAPAPARTVIATKRPTPKPAPGPAAARTQHAPASREWWRTPSGQDAEFRRRLEAAGYREGSHELILEQMHDELYLYKHGHPRFKLAAA